MGRHPAWADGLVLDLFSAVVVCDGVGRASAINRRAGAHLPGRQG